MESELIKGLIVYGPLGIFVVVLLFAIWRVARWADTKVISPLIDDIRQLIKSVKESNDKNCDTNSAIQISIGKIEVAIVDMSRSQVNASKLNAIATETAAKTAETAAKTAETAAKTAETSARAFEQVIQRAKT